MNVTNNEGYTFTFDNNKNTIEVVDISGVCRKVAFICWENGDISLREQFQKLAEQNRTFQIQYLKEKSIVVIGQYGLAGGGILGRVAAVGTGVAEMGLGVVNLPVNPVGGAALIGSGFNVTRWACTASDNNLTFSNGLQAAGQGAAAGAAAALAIPVAAGLAAPLGSAAATAAGGAAGSVAADMANTGARAAINRNPAILNEITPQRIAQNAVVGVVTAGVGGVLGNTQVLQETFNTPLITQTFTQQQVQVIAQTSASGAVGATTGATARMVNNHLNAVNYLQVMYEGVPDNASVLPGKMYLYFENGDIKYKVRTHEPDPITVLISDQYQALPMPLNGNNLFHTISHQLTWLDLPTHSAVQLRELLLSYLDRNPQSYPTTAPEPLSQYRIRMRSNDQPGGNFEIGILCAALRVCILLDNREQNPPTLTVFGDQTHPKLNIMRFDNSYRSKISHGTFAQIDGLRNVFRTRTHFTEQQKALFVKMASMHGHGPGSLTDGVGEAFLTGAGGGILVGAMTATQHHTAAHRHDHDRFGLRRPIDRHHGTDRARLAHIAEHVLELNRAARSHQNSYQIAEGIYNDSQTQTGNQQQYIQNRLQNEFGISGNFTDLSGIQAAVLANRLASANLVAGASGSIYLDRTAGGSVLPWGV